MSKIKEVVDRGLIGTQKGNKGLYTRLGRFDSK